MEQNYTLKMKINRRTNVTKDGRKFFTYKTQMLLADKEGNELKPRWIDVKFGKDVNINQIKGNCIIEVNSEDVFAPFKYAIGVKTDKNGVVQYESDGKTPKKEYPHVYIKNVLKVNDAPRKKTTQNAFILDEPATEETSID